MRRLRPVVAAVAWKAWAWAEWASKPVVTARHCPSAFVTCSGSDSSEPFAFSADARVEYSGRVTVTAGERHEYQRDHDKPAPQAPKAGADPIAELSREPSVDDAVKVIAANPARRDQIMATLQQRMGNGFVQQVIVAMTARPAPTALPLTIHPAGQSKTDAILQDNAAALDKGRRLEELGSKHLSQITSMLIPAYGKARDELDVQGVTELGSSIIGSLQLARASTDALTKQHTHKKKQKQPNTNIAIEGAEAGQDAALQSQLTINRGLLKVVELAVLSTLP